MRRRRSRRKPSFQKPTREHRINHEIRSSDVRIVGIGDESANEVIPTKEALKRSNEMGLDLVEISGKGEIPIVKIIDYKKFAYDLRKKKKENQAKQHKTQMKELRFGPNTDDHDLDFKLKNARKFLESGNKLKTYVQFRGRSIVHKDRGRELLDTIAERLSDLAKVEQHPKMNGRRMIMVMSPE